MPPKDATAPLFLYVDNDYRLQVGTWSAQVFAGNMVYTKGGGVVGFVSNNDPWDASDVRFNPTSNVYAGTTAGFQSIPRWDTWTPGEGESKPTEYGVDKNVDFFSVAPYHTIDNVKRGFGDICQLVGYAGEAINAMDALPTPKYRLPTNPENSTFVGYDDDGDGIPSGVAHSGAAHGSGSNIWTAAYGTYTSGYPGNMTLHKSSPANVVLYMLGHRSVSGAPEHWNHDGHYWSSTPISDTWVFDLCVFNNGITPSWSNDSILGLTVRCVPVD